MRYRDCRPIDAAPVVRAAMAAAPLAAGAGCAAGPDAPVAECMPEPALYEWQVLDASNLVVWLLPSEIPYHVALEEPVPEAGAVAAMQFVDGNRDGLICGEGSDSLRLADEEAPEADSVREQGPVAGIRSLRPLSRVALEELREMHRETLGVRRETGEIIR